MLTPHSDITGVNNNIKHEHSLRVEIILSKKNIAHIELEGFLTEVPCLLFTVFRISHFRPHATFQDKTNTKTAYRDMHRG